MGTQAVEHLQASRSHHNHYFRTSPMVPFLQYLMTEAGCHELTVFCVPGYSMALSDSCTHSTVSHPFATHPIQGASKYLHPTPS